MKTIKFKVKNYTETEKEIQLPFYGKSNSHTYKVFSDDEYNSCISICYDGSISIVHKTLPFTKDDLKEITEAEYKKVFDKAVKKLENL